MTKYEGWGFFGICALLIISIIVSSNPINYVGNNNISSVIVSPLESNGAIPVNIQDQHTPAFDIFFSQSINQTFLDSNAILDEYTINATTGHNIQVGEQLVLFDSATQRAYVGNVLAVLINDISLDTPLNDNFSVASTIVARTTNDLNVDGSTTRQTFRITSPINQSLDVTRIMFQIITASAPDFAKFGDITGGLDKGVMVRIVNGRTTNLFNVKTNGELVNLMYDVTFYDTSNPGQGVFGLGGRLTYGGPSKHGVTLRIDPGDEIEVIIQDDLTDLVAYHMIASGHIVTD